MQSLGERIKAMLRWCYRLLERIGISWRDRVWPAIRGWLGSGYGVARQRVLPAVGSGTLRLKGELVNIHRQQNWLSRCSTTLTGNAAGLGMAMLSTRVVESMVEKRELSNLWGVFADRPVVSETTFEVLTFVVEFVLALLVFTVTEYYVAAYQRRREARQFSSAGAED